MDLKEAAEYFRSVSRIRAAHRHALNVLNFDGMTAAPRSSAAGRSVTCAVLSGALHSLETEPEYLTSLETLCAHASELPPVLKREAELCLAEASELLRIPQEVCAAHSRLTGEAFSAWQAAKAASDFSLLAPHLERVFESAGRIASFAAPGADPYEYWLLRSEPGADAKTLDSFFDLIKSELAPLLSAVSRLPKPDNSFLYGRFEKSKQRLLSLRLMEIMGIDPMRCAVAEAEHPYTTVIGRNDVRITTHYYSNYVAANMFTVLHEGGHALYALNLAPELSGTALEFAASAGMNEAISRFYENIIGRSREFARLILPELEKLFPREFAEVSADALFRAVNRAEPTLKRTEADELTYPLHIMIRYYLERDLMHGALSVADLPDAWNALYKEFLGIEPPDDARGCLQDMHWASGLIGYFPTYALGNAYGAQIFGAMRRSLDFEAAVSGGRIADITGWLAENLLEYGMLYEPSELISRCCGAAFDPRIYADHLKSKFSELYGLTASGVDFRSGM